MPFRLHGARMKQQRKYHASTVNLDRKVDSNEHTIEIEFLKLFDYARCKLYYLLQKDMTKILNFIDN